MLCFLYLTQYLSQSGISIHETMSFLLPHYIVGRELGATVVLYPRETSKSDIKLQIILPKCPTNSEYEDSTKICEISLLILFLENVPPRLYMQSLDNFSETIIPRLQLTSTENLPAYAFRSVNISKNSCSHMNACCICTPWSTTWRWVFLQTLWEQQFFKEPFQTHLW